MSFDPEFEEKAIKPVGFENIQVLQDTDEIRSVLMGKVYGPWLQGQVVNVPEDVVKQLVPERAIKTKLAPEEVDKTLWLIYAEVLAAARLIPERFRRQFYQQVDGNLNLDANKQRVLTEARRLVSLFAPLPYRRETIVTQRPLRAAPSIPVPTGPEGAPMPFIGEIEGRSPIDNRAMDRIRTFEHQGLIYKVKEFVRLFRERPGTFRVEAGMRVPREPNLYLAGMDGMRVTEIEEVVKSQFAVPMGITRAETRAAMAYKAFLNSGRDMNRVSDIASEFGLTEERVKQIIEKGQKEGLSSLFEEPD